jgi:hypothetical protein
LAKNEQSDSDFLRLRDSLDEDFLKLYGPVLTGDEIQKALRYPSVDAYRKSVTLQRVPVPLFEMENRRGKFALSKDVAHYLATRRFQSIAD